MNDEEFNYTDVDIILMSSAALRMGEISFNCDNIIVRDKSLRVLSA